MRAGPPTFKKEENQMIAKSVLPRMFFASAACIAVAVCAIALTARPAQAIGSELDCGPVVTWSCEGNGLAVRFTGTACDKTEFEREKGVKCVATTHRTSVETLLEKGGISTVATATDGGIDPDR